jgi:SSS family solute:Na+ symporter
LNLTSTDCLVSLLYLALLFTIGYGLRTRIKTVADFFNAGRSLPAWLCGIAYLTAGLGLPLLIVLGAAGARLGFAAAHLFFLISIPAMLFAGTFLLPVFYASDARTVPGYLRLRFDSKTATLSASLFAVMALLSSAVAIALVSVILSALHIFDGIFRAMDWPLQATFVVAALLPAIVVLACVALGGLRAAIHSQLVQFAVLLGGFFPVIFLGLKKIGGWSGLKSSLPADLVHPFIGAAYSAVKPATLILTLVGGVIFSAAYWCSDFRLVQIPMAAKDFHSARRAPILAGALAIFVLLLLIVPGLVAIGLPTPHTTSFTRYENGAIFHTITVVRPEVEQGNGLVPARVDPATDKPMLDPSGHALLNYQMATPNLLVSVLPNGLLGLGLTALLASLMSGLAASVAAFSTVFTVDLYQPSQRRDAKDDHFLAVGRLASAAAVFISVAAAWYMSSLANVFFVLILVFSIVSIPLFATVLLGIFWRRTTGHGAFAGLASGATAALLHHSLTVATNAHSGLQGGWIAPLHVYRDSISQACATAIVAFAAAIVVSVLVSLSTEPRPEAELTNLVCFLTPRPKSAAQGWWNNPFALDLAILLLAALALILFSV